MTDPKALVAGARRRLGRAYRAATTAAPADAPAELAALRAELDKARRNNARLRAKMKSLRAEMNAERASVRDPEPDLVLDEAVEKVIDDVRDEKLTFLRRPNLAALARVVVGLDHHHIPGAIVEAGTALGGSAIVMGKAKDINRPMYVYDVFGLIPPPSDRDGADVHERYEKITAGQAAGHQGEEYYGYRDNLYDEVTESFVRNGVSPDEHNIQLVQGLFEDTITLDEPVALAHLDGDWYESTMVCLERLAPLIVPRGRIVLDDYYAWSGCRTAVDEFFKGRPGWRLERRAKIHAVRLAD